MKIIAKKFKNLFAVFTLSITVSVLAQAQTISPIDVNLDENCIVTILNGSTRVNTNGTFSLRTSLPDDVPYRARAICDVEGQLFFGESVLIDGVPDSVTDTGEISFVRSTPVPISLNMSLERTQLTPDLPSVQIVVTGNLPNDEIAGLTIAEVGTVYRNSNPEIATVSENGFVTGLKNGRVIISARNEGALASVEIDVLFPEDADGDGLSDSYEQANGLNPNDPNDAFLDQDNDGLTNLEEFLLGTSPIFADTDGDTISDFDEAENGTDPNNPDTDGDGLVDGEELLRGTDPLSNDSDNDGILDGDEIRFGSDPLAFDDSTSLVGRIVDADGAVVENASVIALDRYSDLSDADGFFRIDSVPVVVGSMSVLARVIRDGQLLDGSSAETLPVPGGVTDVGDISVAMVIGRLTGLVLSPRGELVPNARVSAFGLDEGRFTNADITGRYTLDDLPNAELEVQALDPRTGLVGRTETTVSSDQTQNANITLGAFGTIRGVGFESDGVTSVGEAISVELRTTGGTLRASSQTNVFGEYVFDFVPLGSYIVDITGANGERGRTIAVLSGTTQILNADVLYLGTADVRGIVESAAGIRLPNADVNLASSGIFGGTQVVQTNSLGEFVFTDVFVGNFTLFSQDEVRGTSGLASAEIQFDGDDKDLAITLAATGSLSGTIVQSDGVTPQSGASVSIAGQSSVSDDSGNYSFEFVPLGNYIIEVSAANGDLGQAITEINAEGENVTTDVQLNGLGTVNASVISSNGQTVSDVQITINTGAPFNETYSAITDANGSVTLSNVLAGNIAVNAFDPIDRLGGLLNTSLLAGETVDVIINLEPSADIMGVVFQPDGITPAANITLTTQPGNNTQTTAADGRYRFNMLPLAQGPYSIRAEDSNGVLRAQTDEIVVVQDGEQVEADITIDGLGNVAGVVFNPSGATVAVDAVVELQSSVPGAGQRLTRTNLLGEFSFEGVPVGNFNVEASFVGLRFAGNESASIDFDGEQKTVDIQMLENQLPSSINTVASLFDANNFSYPVQRDGSIQDGTRSLFAGDGDAFRGASRLDIFKDGELFPFFNLNQDNIALEEGGREVAINGANGSGVDVTRKVYVPLDGYFSRHIDTFTNPAVEPVTVSVRVDTHFRIAVVNRGLDTPSLDDNVAGLRVPVGVISTSSGDNFLSVNPSQSDRWAVFDDDLDTDPFNTVNLPAVGYTFDGDNAQVNATNIEFLSGDSGQFNRMRAEWQDITIQPSESVSLMYFTAQQTTRSAALASAQRLLSLPPEAIDDLTQQELTQIVNFSIPSDGVSLVPPLPDLLSTVSGTVLEANLTETVSNAEVSFQSDHPLFQREIVLSSDESGNFSIEGQLENGQSVVVPDDSAYTLNAIHPQTLIDAASVQDVVSLGAGLSTIVFENTGSVSGTVRRFDGVVASFGQIELMGTNLPRALTLSIPEDGQYRFTGLPVGTYTLIATLPNPDGTGIGGTVTAQIENATEIVRDITLAEVGGITGQVLTPAGEVVSGIRVELISDDFTRNVLSDTGGTFRFLDTPSGDYQLSLVDPVTRQIISETVSVIDEQLVSQDLILTPVGRVILGVTFEDGTPARNALVRLQSEAFGSAFIASGIVRTDGTATIDNIPLGSFVVRVLNPNNTNISEEFAGAVTTHGQELSAQLVIPIDNPPQVTITQPTDNLQIIKGQNTLVSAQVEDDFGINRVEFLRDGQALAVLTQAPFETLLRADNDSADQSLVFTVRAIDDAGNIVEDSVSVVLLVDNEPPTTAFLSPNDGSSIIEGQTLNFSASASDNVAVENVTFLVNQEVVVVDNSAPYNFNFSVPNDFANAGETPINIEVRTTDFSGNVAADQRTVTVLPDLAPELTIVQAPNDGDELIEGTLVSVIAQASDDVQVSRVELLVDGEVLQTRFTSPYQFTFDAPLLDNIVNPIQTVVRAVDSMGQITDSVPLNLVVTRDNLPSVDLLAPLDNTQIIEGSIVTLEAQASDDVAVVRVDFFAGDQLIGSDASAPYTISQRLTSGVNGTLESYTAVAIDTRNQEASDSTVVERQDDLIPPAVAITAPQDGAIITVGPSDVAIVIDTSGSTGSSSGADIDGDGINDDILDAEIFAAKELLNFLNPETTSVAVVDFSSSAILVQSLTNDFEQVNQALDQILAAGPGGGTNFSAAMSTATNELAGPRSRSFATPVQLFLSDGSAGVPTQEIQRAADGAIIVNSFAVGSGANISALEQIADGTGGVATPVSDASQIVDILPSIVLFGIDTLVSIADAQDDIAVREVAFNVASDDGSLLVSNVDTVAPFSEAAGLPTIDQPLQITVSATATDFGDNSVAADPISVTLLPAENTPRLVRVEPEFAVSQQLVTVLGEFLVSANTTQPSSDDENILATTRLFYNDVEIIPDFINKITVRFFLPADAVDGEIFVIADGVQTNSINIFIDDDQDGLSNAQEGVLGTNPSMSDSDGDGLNDGDEVNLHLTDPLNEDTDSDGLPDGLELNNFLDPLDPADAALDADNDGLTNLEELGLGTGIRSSDSDNDGLIDGLEVNTELTNPLDSDSDDDGLIDGLEVNTIGSNPLAEDSDGDGLDDQFEFNNGLNAISASDRDEDADADGLTNFEEFELGTNVQNSDTDGDGLTDFDEVNNIGTNPLLTDTDGGGDSDGFEITRSTDPLDPADDITVTLDFNLFDGGGFVWDVNEDGRINNGTSDAYDGGLRLSVNFNSFNFFNTALSEDSRRELLIGAETVSALNVSRKVFVPETESFARFLEILENPTTEDIVASVQIFSDFGSGSGTQVISTSSGDTLVDSQDTSIITDDASDGGGDPTLIHMWGNSQSSILADVVTLTNNDDFTVRYDTITVPANSRVIVMHLASQNLGSVAAIDNLSVLESIPESVTMGMDLDELEDVINFTLAPDTDGDGLSDLREAIIGTDPLLEDTDGDTLIDGFEVEFGFDPFVINDATNDSDGDGLNDAEEQSNGTNPLNPDSDQDGLDDFSEVTIHLTDPNNPDTDGDNLSDSFEVTNGFDPLQPTDLDPNADIDGDGLTNGQELNIGTSLVDADTDGDGMDDGFEVNNSLDPLSPEDANDDNDGDGLDNLGEFNAGTFPNNPDSDFDGLNDGTEVNTTATNPLMFDTDADGLNDGDEVNVHATNPLVADTDSDGLSDSYEVNNGLLPLDSSDAVLDLDSDGLTNLEEFTLGTNPANADTDNDGLSDNDEVNSSLTDPLNPDTDSDQLLDGFEVNAGFDPLAAGETELDSDSDGVSNFLEQVQGSDPLVVDTDGDGVSDLNDGAPTDPLISIVDILIVNDADNFGNPGDSTAYIETAEEMGASFNVWDVGQGLPPRFVLARHRLIVWFGGLFGGLEGNEESLLQNYLNGGGCYFLSAQDYHFNVGFTPFMSQYLGLQSINDDSFFETTATGVGSLYPVAQDYVLNYPFSNFADHMEVATASPFMVDNSNTPALTIGTNYDSGTFATTYLGFPLEAVQTAAERADILQRVFDSCSYTHDLSVPDLPDFPDSPNFPVPN